MFALTFTLTNGTTRHDFSHLEGTIEEVQTHYERLIECGRSGHPFMGRDYADCVSVKVEQA